MPTIPRIAAFLVFLLASGSEGKKLNRNAPHDHKGTLSPYKPGPFDVLKLGSKDEKILAGNKPVMKQIPGDGGGSEGGRAICIQDIDAPKTAVWNQILDLDHYVGKVNKVKICKNYMVKKNKDGTSTIKTKMVIGVMPGYSVSLLKFALIDPFCHPPFHISFLMSHACVQWGFISLLLRPQYEYYCDYKYTVRVQVQ